ncbi:hypothetical protein EPA93_19715 [Ktedonosporobacter rubrisoli]|uniref:Zinc-ribbon domain-containing protein n=1 Tax=Ktedonosporobacter rubrisoli TaxID=2509675 RepID=A0A4P6JSC7_KTERU|nr:hypothetical protein [Ktedonosporobacter rubrisoli]QBD78102.1 hypothetical protein EPA93_19715 [Ktedonosporobacter rubrisoli]
MIALFTLLMACSIIVGTRGRNRVLGQLAYPCAGCRQHTYHTVVHTRQWLTLYFIPILPLGALDEARCNLCGYREWITSQQVKAWFPSSR